MGELEPVERRHRLRNVRPVGGDAGAVRRLLQSVTALYDRAVDSVLSTPHVVPSLAEARRLLDQHSSEGDHVAEQVNRVALLALPVLRRMQQAGRLARLPGVRRLPAVASIATAASIGSALNRGVRDVQVIGSYVATRLERASGTPADPALVKRLTVQLYLDPSRPPQFDQRVGSARLLRRWLTRGVMGRDSRKAAQRSLEAVSRLDPDRVLAGWRARGGR